MMTREQAVEVAKSWVGTPYALRARVKQGGADCATYLAEYSIEIGAAQREELPIYKADWFLHTTDNLYLMNLMRSIGMKATIETVANRVLREAKLGDLMLFKHDNLIDRYTHGGVFVGGTRIVHAVRPRVGETNYLNHTLTSGKRVAIFSPWRDDV